MEASAAVGDFLFDDDRWVARYLVTEDRQHLHPPACAHLAHLLSRGGLAFARFHLALRKEQVKNSPDIDHRQPVSRQRERELHRYYGLGVSRTMGDGGLSGHAGDDACRRARSSRRARVGGKDDDVHLRSVNEVHNLARSDVDGWTTAAFPRLAKEAVRALTFEGWHRV
jgi:hypothetical protein